MGKGQTVQNQNVNAHILIISDLDYGALTPVWSELSNMVKWIFVAPSHLIIIRTKEGVRILEFVIFAQLIVSLVLDGCGFKAIVCFITVIAFDVQKTCVKKVTLKDRKLVSNINNR